ncbi:MAG: hypothetical protein ACW97G_00495 [Candidatus Thorarchaeota archaeon]
MSNDIDTHLQALYHSGQISGYVHSKLTDGSLKTGWIEQGLLAKGMKGNLRDKNNQESLVIPADRFARLARDRGGREDAAFVIIGSKGLVTSKFVAMVFGNQDSQSLIAFEIQKTSPHEIIRFLLQNALGKKTSQLFEEPNLDYVEQLRIDASEGEVNEMTVFTLPKKQVKMSEWMKDALLSPSSESVEIQHGTSNTIPKFAALITRWLTGLELFKGTASGIAAIVFVGQETMDACFWDQPQGKAAFMIFNNDNFESLSRKYLTPLWVVPGESVESLKPTREVTVEPRKVSVDSKQPSSTKKHEKQILVSTSDAEKTLANLSRRLDSLESQLKSSKPDSVVTVKDSGKSDVLRSKLAVNIDRIESLSKRLSDLEKRIREIRS